VEIISLGWVKVVILFKYRLEKVLNLREQELEKVKAEFQEAANRVHQIEAQIHENRHQQTEAQKTLMTPKGLRSPNLYINRLKYLKNELEKLEKELIQAKEALVEVRQRMLEAQQKMETLKRHKQKKKEEYDREEARKEEIELNEMALIMRRMKEDQNANQ